MIKSLLLFSNLKLKNFNFRSSSVVIILLFTLTFFLTENTYAQPFLVGVHDNKIQTFNSTDYSSVSAEFTLSLPGKIVNKGNAVTWNSDNQLYYAIVETDPEFLYPDYHLVIVDPSTGNCVDLATIGNVRNSSFSSITYCPADSNLYYMYEASPPEFFYSFFTLFKYHVPSGVITGCSSYSYSNSSINLNPLVSYNNDDGLLYNLYKYVDFNTNTEGVRLQKINTSDFGHTVVGLSGDTLENSDGGMLYLGSGSFALTTGGTKGYKLTSSGSATFISNMPYEKIAGFGYSDIPLPVELASFTSSVDKNNVTLQWSTAAETNNSGFEIERAIDNGQLTIDSWTNIGNVNGNGTSAISHSYSFTDRNLASGKYSYRLKQIDFNGNFEYFNLNNEVNIGVPSYYSLSQNYPNPFNPTTNLEFGISDLGFVSLKIYDISGKEVASLVNEVKPAGYYTVSFNGANLSSGIYFYTIKAGDFVSTKRMILLK